MAQLKEIFAYNLKKKRQECGFTQAQLAEKTDVSTHHIGMLEIARNYPTLELVERIAHILNIETYELFIDPLSPREELERLYQTIIVRLPIFLIATIMGKIIILKFILIVFNLIELYSRSNKRK
jgi:transcriptional regulator with XRE-family HTH domain